MSTRQKKPSVSIVVVVYRMKDQAMKTLESLTDAYQCGISRDKYEVVIVENPSDQMLDSHSVCALGPQFRYYSMDNISASPVAAVNFGIENCRAPFIGLMIDGARLLTPGVLHYALQAYAITENAIVAVPGYHLGKKLQQLSAGSGYDKHVEEELLESIHWPENGYALFKVSCFSGSCAGGFFRPIAESNCLFAPAMVLRKLGGCDPGFTSAGGGYVNLDLYRRLCEEPETTLFMLPGEGTFHQFHGGVTTSKQYGDVVSLQQQMLAEYENLRGKKYRVPDVSAIFLGEIGLEVMPFVMSSAQQAINID